KYDLLETYCQEFVKKPGLTPPQGNSRDFSVQALSKILAVVDEEHEFLQRIVELNAHGIVFQQMKIAMVQEAMNLYNEGELPPAPLPRDLDAQLTASMIIAICQWWLENYNDYSSQDVMAFFTNMLAAMRQS
ncbi:MAG: hypothetical protein II528_06180, partial [Lachnospiraceae bacterium]|nr:hypothetical protein [Lachnospiraceae bacterium]